MWLSMPVLIVCVIALGVTRLLLNRGDGLEEVCAQGFTLDSERWRAVISWSLDPFGIDCLWIDFAGDEPGFTVFHDLGTGFVRTASAALLTFTVATVMRGFLLRRQSPASDRAPATTAQTL